MSEKNVCATCFYKAEGRMPGAIQTHLECRRYPPVPLVAGPQIVFIYPAVQPTLTCGEYKAALSLVS